MSLSIASWRTEDLPLWKNQIIPAFNAEHPDIKVTFEPTTNTEYNAALDSKLDGGTAADIITCRPFDLSDALNQQGHLVPLGDLKGINSFPELARSAWAADDGTPFCVPMASVIHGFYYNADIFAKLGLKEPTTQAEFVQVLQAIKDDGKYAPLAWGTADEWIASQTAFTNVGPGYWHGEDGRRALVSGEKKFTDPQFVAAWQALADWQPFFPKGYQGITYTDTQQLFTLGRAAIFPGGSWEITSFKDAKFKIGVFPPPVPKQGDDCYITDHTDIAMGINAASKKQEAARTFLEWVTGGKFAGIYANKLPGFFPLTKEEVTIDEPLAKEFVSFRDECKSTVRLPDEKLSAGKPNTDNQVGALTVQMWNGKLTPEKVAQEMQRGLASWYQPQR
ncbi:ABC transporter substrate-binding protein [Micromonospora sp. NBC_01412]|uniref:ABC transporter substrate-binding protein n=1 Tax=Micromonospora sp. NBC_01412 TaxID=2903590 RepID=UPI003243EA8F